MKRTTRSTSAQRARSAEPRIIDTGPTEPRVGSDLFAVAIGARRLGVSPRGGSPISRAAVRQELARLLRSTGGRPGLEGSLRRQKIPLSDDEWIQLEYLSDLFEQSGIKATAGQVARVLLRLALERVARDEGAPSARGTRRRARRAA